MEAVKDVTESGATDLGALLDAGDDAVVTLVAGDTRLVAHRAVLAARSPVFEVMFRHDMLEARSGQVNVTDVEGPVLRQLLAYAYTLQTPQLPGMAPQLLAAADKYGLPLLKAECGRQVAAQLSVETAAAAAVLAVRHSCTGLREAAVDFIRANFVRVVGTRGWADAMLSQPKDLVVVSKLLSDAPAEASAPAPADSGATPAAQPHSGHSGRTPASAAPTTAARHTATPNYAAVCPLWNLSAEEKGKRLIEAAKDGAEEVLEALFAAGVDVGARDEERKTALYWAASNGQVEAARRLLAAGAAPGAGDRTQWTPLHEAAYSGHAAVVRLLVEEASADVNARDVDGRTPLHAAAVNDKAEAAAALLQAGADKTARDDSGATPLDDARVNNHQQLIDMLT